MKDFRALLMLLLTPLVGCGPSSSQSSASAASTATTSHVPANSAPPASSSSTARGPTCPRTGLWALCSVETRLIQSGFVVRRAAVSAPRRAGFSVAPAAYTLGRASQLEVFIYPSEQALSADVARIDTVFAAPRGAKNPWKTVPTFARSANMAAVLVTDNPTQAERFTLALTAGAPQR